MLKCHACQNFAEKQVGLVFTIFIKSYNFESKLYTEKAYLEDNCLSQFSVSSFTERGGDC